MKKIESQRYGSLARNILRILGVGSKGSGREDTNLSSPSSHSLEGAEPKTFNLQAHISGKRRMHEVESQKAISLSMSRHERWKAGGPV